MDGEAVAPLPISILDKRDARPKAGRRDVLDNMLGAEPHHNDELAHTDRREIAHDLGQDCAPAEGQQRLRHLIGVGPKAAATSSSDDDRFHLCITPESQWTSSYLLRPCHEHSPPTSVQGHRNDATSIRMARRENRGDTAAGQSW